MSAQFKPDLSKIENELTVRPDPEGTAPEYEPTSLRTTSHDQRRRA